MPLVYNLEDELVQIHSNAENIWPNDHHLPDADYSELLYKALKLLDERKVDVRDLLPQYTHKICVLAPTLIDGATSLSSASHYIEHTELSQWPASQAESRAALRVLLCILLAADTTDDSLFAIPEVALQPASIDLMDVDVQRYAKLFRTTSEQPRFQLQYWTIAPPEGAVFDIHQVWVSEQLSATTSRLTLETALRDHVLEDKDEPYKRKRLQDGYHYIYSHLDMGGLSIVLISDTTKRTTYLCLPIEERNLSHLINHS